MKYLKGGVRKMGEDKMFDLVITDKDGNEIKVAEADIAVEVSDVMKDRIKTEITGMTLKIDVTNARRIHWLLFKMSVGAAVRSLWYTIRPDFKKWCK
jgi:hypothetical protein